jgi:hypothetical protein
MENHLEIETAGESVPSLGIRKSEPKASWFAPLLTIQSVSTLTLSGGSPALENDGGTSS